ncbi:hypothetical protein TSOC_004361 [Tetrabaena socialis]|uniref:YHYH domain-containing protein n=1 Tax=Tetrabaena socialis TaxID=47790 RepID=A0A2J8A944_9CHLO|nr:hypothetical protein TSOC_004361 [Tetrabaena socialis]|eukprot:PNH09021.1 hypothetical protein TSOC_004361 [Tetrabaena socialis]
MFFFSNPPQIGWSLDGPPIYGRYLAATAPGATSQPLDACGGHEHDTYGYHYHSQVLSVTTSSRAHPAVGAGVNYAASTPGVYQCWRGDVSKTPGGTTVFFGTNTQEYDRPCCGMTAYYAAAGITINGAGALDSSSPAAAGGSSSPPPAAGGGSSPPPVAGGGSSPPPVAGNGAGGTVRVTALEVLFITALALASCALLT